MTTGTQSTSSETTGDVDTGICRVCDEEVPLDGKQAMERFGSPICRECSDEEVVFVAECESLLCPWSFRASGVEFNRGYIRTRAQQEANNHQSRKRVFENNPCHKTEVEEIPTVSGDTADADAPVLLPDGGTDQQRVDSPEAPQYAETTFDDQSIVVGCPECGDLMLLGRIWKELMDEGADNAPPPCPDCSVDGEGDEWSDDAEPKISEQRADIITVDDSAVGSETAGEAATETDAGVTTDTEVDSQTDIDAFGEEPTFRDNRAEAIFSEDRTYRYKLWRRWDASKPTLGVIMLNPSTADETEDDNTIRRCINYAKEWGYGSLVVGNLFAARATNPEELPEKDDPVGPENDRHIREIVDEADMVLAAWGTHGALDDRCRSVANALDTDLYALDTTKEGHPIHPLYQPTEAEPTLWEGYDDG